MAFSAAQARCTATRLSKRVASLNQFAGHSVSSATACVDYPDETPSSATSSSHSSDSAHLLREMRDLARSGRVRDALKVLNFMAFADWKPSVSDYNSLLCSYLKSRSMKLDELFRIYACLRESGVSPNALTYNALFNGMVFVDCLSDALSVVVEMHRNGYSPSFQSLSKLLKGLLRSDELRYSVYVVEFMLLLDYSPTDPVLSLLISKLIDFGMLDESCRVLNSLLCKGCYCAPFVYNPVLWALCKYDCCVVSLSLFSSMKKRCFVLHVFSSLFCSMKKRGFVLNVCSYTALVYGFSRHGLWDEVGRVFGEMDSFGCTPNVITYTVTAKHLCDFGKIEEAFGILNGMEEDGCQPDTVIYNVIFRALLHSNRMDEANRMDELWDMFSLFERKGLSLDPYSYTAIAGGMLKMGYKEEAHQILADAILRGSKMDVGVYNLYLHTLCLTDRLFEALTVVQEMSEGDLRPNNISYNTILSAACKAENISVINSVLEKMHCQGIKHNVVSFTCLIKYYCCIGRISECFKLLEYMLHDGIAPSTMTLNVLIHRLCKKRLFGAAQQILTSFRNIGIFPDSVTYNIFLDAALRARADVLAGELLQEMNREGVKPDVATLINFLCKMGKISDAFDRLNMMLENDVVPDVSIYNNYLSAMLRRGKVGDAVKLLKHMDVHGCKTDIASVRIMERAIFKGRMKGFPQAKELLEFARRGINGNQQIQ